MEERKEGREVKHWDRKERLRRHAMKPRHRQWHGDLVRFRCRGCKRVYVHRSSLNRHMKKCKLDMILWKRLKTKAVLRLGIEAMKPSLPKPPKRMGRPPHILSRCVHCPRTFETAEKKRDHQRRCLQRQQKNIVKIVDPEKNGGNQELDIMIS